MGYVHSKRGSRDKKDEKRARILFDTGCGGCLINKQLVKHLKLKTDKSTKWHTKAGSFRTTQRVKCNFLLPEFHENREITWKMYVEDSDPKQSNYDMIIGRDLLNELGMDFSFKQGTMTWDFAEIPMKPENALADLDQFEQECMFLHDPDTTEAERIQQIHDLKYAPADLQKELDQCPDLASDQKEKLLGLLQKFEELFDGSLGKWKTEDINIKLKPDATPHHAKPYPVPHSQEQKLKDEVQRLVQHGILKKVNHSEWASPMFTITKPDGSLRSLADLRELNKRIIRNPFPIPKIQEMLLKLRGFQWATSLDLNMGYYHIQLNPDARKYCTIVLPWGKYEYLRLPMGICNAPDIFQEKMSELMADLEFVRTYIDDVLIITSDTFEDHLTKLKITLTRLLESGLK